MSLVDVRPSTAWSRASDRPIGITPMMDFFRDYYGKSYAPNSRETVRRQTVHQFLQAGLISINPDKPARAVTSGQTVYQIRPEALDLLRSYGFPAWEAKLEAYLQHHETLTQIYAEERQMQRIPLKLKDGTVATITGGGQNVLVERIINEFCELFTPGAELLYVGDAGSKWAIYEEGQLAGLGVKVGAHGKMPDVIVFYKDKGWLVLIEAVTSHGPVSPKRKQELRELFAGSNVGIVYVTAFLDRAALRQYIGDIAWETEVWVAEAPTHLVHFNGERFLGPHE